MDDTIKALQVMAAAASIEDCRVLSNAVIELERLREREDDLRNVLKAALYLESGGIDLVHRLTTYAVNNRKQPN